MVHTAPNRKAFDAWGHAEKPLHPGLANIPRNVLRVQRGVIVVSAVDVSADKGNGTTPANMPLL
jgi:hypothetical protein